MNDLLLFGNLAGATDHVLVLLVLHVQRLLVVGILVVVALTAHYVSGRSLLLQVLAAAHVVVLSARGTGLADRCA